MSDLTSVLASQALSVAQQTEAQLDAAISSYSVSSSSDFESLRRQRLEELKLRAKRESQWKQLGHGSYDELQDQKDWFEECKKNDLVICHFGRPSTWRCELVDRHLAILATRHIETRFVKIDAEKCPFLAERLNIVLLPTIVMMKNNFTHDRLEGFDELGGTDKFTTEELERRLAAKGMIEYEEKPEAILARANKKSLNNRSNPTGKAIYSSRKPIDSEEDESEDEN